MTGSLGAYPEWLEGVDVSSWDKGHVRHVATKVVFSTASKALGNDVTEESFVESLGGKKEEMISISKKTMPT